VIDPFEKENLPTDVDARRMRSLEAEELVNEKGVFMLAIKSLARKWYAEMVTSPEKQRMEAAAMKLQVLESIEPEIRRFITDQKFAVDKARKHG
jgi:hypothetical protein